MRRLLRSMLVTGASAAWLLAMSPPAKADNCSGLSDCSLGMTIALAVLAVVAVAAILMLGWAVAADLAAMGAAEGLAAEELGAWSFMNEAVTGANPTGSLTNCSKVVQVVSTRLSTGSTVVAGEGVEGTSLYGLAEKVGGSVYGEGLSASGIEAAMASAPEGGQGVVYVWNQANGYSHVFNAISHGGTVVYGDGQIGAVGWTAAEVAAESGYTGSDLVWYLISMW